MINRRTWLFGLPALVPLAAVVLYATAAPSPAPAVAEPAAGSCCPDESCCPDGSCCPECCFPGCCTAPQGATVKAAPAKAASYRPDDPCCPDGACRVAGKAADCCPSCCE